jgi:hypothetical protein
VGINGIFILESSPRNECNPIRYEAFKLGENTIAMVRYGKGRENISSDKYSIL